MSLLFHDSLDVAHDGRHRLAGVKLCKEQTGKPGVVLRTIENAKTRFAFEADSFPKMLQVRKIPSCVIWIQTTESYRRYGILPFDIHSIDVVSESDSFLGCLECDDVHV